MIAALEAFKAGLFKPKLIPQNLIAGLIVGVVALPLSMAFAIASGAKPEQGLYTAIVAGLCVSLFGGSRVQIAGPTGAFIVVLASITAKHGIDGLQIATLMAGVILFFLGFARLGAIIRFIPDPVIVGFTAGIAIIIWVGQWREFFGLPAVHGEHFHSKLWALLQSFPAWHGTTTALALMSLALILYGPRIPGLRRLPGPLIALVVATLLQALVGFDQVRTIGTAFGGIPQGLPEFHWPQLSLGRMIDLINPAFTIAMLGAIESLLSAVVADSMAGTRHQANQELIGQGLANVLAPLFGGFAATGAIARTATNIKNGGNSPLAGVVHAVFLILVLLFLAPLAYHIPLACLAAILFVVAWNMSEARHFAQLVKTAPRADVVILLITFFLTIFTDLVVAVNIGVILATLQFLRRMASSVEVRQVHAQEMAQDLRQQNIPALPHGVLVFIIEGPFFFAAADSLQHVLAIKHTRPHTIILRLKWVPFIDATGIKALEKVIRNLHADGIRVLLSGANEVVDGKLQRAGLVQLVGETHRFKDFAEALRYVGTVAARQESGPD